MTKKKISPDELELFQDAMGHVKPLGKGAKAPDDHHHERNAFAEDTEDKARAEYFHDHLNAEALDHASVLEHFNASFSRVDRKRLQQGKIKIDATLDLHGFTVEEARDELADFLLEAKREGCKCIRIIHGKGSLGTAPILKNKINQWLPQSQYVLAYCSCLPKHGGTGAVYVLLRGR